MPPTRQILLTTGITAMPSAIAGPGSSIRWSPGSGAVGTMTPLYRTRPTVRTTARKKYRGKSETFQPLVERGGWRRITWAYAGQRRLVEVPAGRTAAGVAVVRKRSAKPPETADRTGRPRKPQPCRTGSQDCRWPGGITAWWERRSRLSTACRNGSNRALRMASMCGCRTCRVARKTSPMAWSRNCNGADCSEQSTKADLAPEPWAGPAGQ